MAFVIRSLPRCGTHMLRTALDQHPEITCHSEVFNPDWGSRLEIEQLKAEGLYDKYTGDKTGFVVHGFTGIERAEVNEYISPLWEVLQRKRPTMIVLEREDLLRRTISVYQALRTQRWHVWKAQPESHALVQPTVQSHEVKQQLDNAIESMHFSLANFPWAMFTTYERLVDEWPREIMAIQQHIGVTRLVATEPQTATQDQRPIHEMVANYS